MEVRRFSMNYQTNEQLSELRLNAMKLEYQRQSELPAVSELTFDERFSMIVTAQINARREAKMKRLIKAADLREPGASLSSIDYDPVRNLSKKEVAALSDCEWVRRGNNLIITGATGVGKTYLMSAFGREASFLMVLGGHLRKNRYLRQERRHWREAMSLGIQQGPTAVTMRHFYSIRPTHAELGIETESSHFAVPDGHINILRPEGSLLFEPSVKLGNDPQTVVLNNIKRREMEARHISRPTILIIEQHGVGRHSITRIHVCRRKRISMRILVHFFLKPNENNKARNEMQRHQCSLQFTRVMSAHSHFRNLI